jgi:hypothetical protein
MNNGLIKNDSRSKKVKLALCLPKHCAMKTYGGMNV